MSSIWTETVKLPTFQRLESDKKTAVLIIGGGIAGILCAYQLSLAGVDYILVEAKRICSGVTENTTAKLTSQHGLVFDRLIREFGVENARLYLQANNDALQTYKELCRGIDCDYEIKDNYVYTLNNEEKIENELKALEKIGGCANYIKNLPLPFQTKGTVSFPNQAQFHPLKFLAEIAQKLNIYENSKVIELGLCIAKTETATIYADNIIVATHYPMNNKHGAYYLKLYQSRSYVAALENAQSVDGMYVDESDTGFSFRNYKGYLLLGGGGHRTGRDGGNWHVIEKFAREHYPEAEIKMRWAAQDCMSLDKVPYIGLYGKHTEGFYVTAGYNKWGMTSAMVSAKLLIDRILSKENPYSQLFQPYNRSMIRKQLFINMAESTANLLTPSLKRCPHMGCALKWNRDEHSWDCPCHGFRFTEDGQLIDNPATSDLKQ
ncbi:MAG: FAD-dependent oxidoreductase [Clostridia bacterium]|nr:FAD-dependent oxidoreductase [Lachnospiraceae bacterium]NCC01501.1 FAD-dependent oxidoreductase [Clostridia bacterium]NCD03346.1 FAD-dependent oxidoreductase [Clostridia bacterium]